jgi:branched-chain amino acid aminotransferase
MASLVPPKEGIEFEKLPWNLNLPDELSYVHVTTTSEWSKEHYDADADTGSIITSVKKYEASPLAIFPSTTSLNYGTTVWEGLKCFRNKDGNACVFRPDRNHDRFARGAEAMCLPVVPKDLFMRGIQTAIQANAHLIPPFGAGMKLYVRPLLFGSGQQLGLHPSPEFSLVFFCSPTGSYFSGSGLNLHLETKRCRAARGGVGSVKCSGNYAVALNPLMNAKKQGYQDNLYLELETYHEGELGKALLQEMSAANVFLVLKTGEIVTPSLSRGTILPGVTRESLVTLIQACAEELHPAMAESTGDSSVAVRVCERDVLVEEFLFATEAFCTGTAAEIVPIARLATGEGEEAFEVNLPNGKSSPGPVTASLLALLRSVMIGEKRLSGCEGWTRDPFASPDEFCME